MYTNCAQYNDNNLLDGTENASEDAACDQVSCLKLAAKSEDINLTTNSNVIVSSESNYIEVSGQCSVSTYPRSWIKYEVFMSNGIEGNYSYKSGEALAVSRENDKCVNGKFNIRVPRPAKYYNERGYSCRLDKPSAYLYPGNLYCSSEESNCPNNQTTCLKNKAGACAQCYQTKFLRGKINLTLYAIDASGKYIEHPSKLTQTINFSDEYCTEGGCF